MAIPWKVLRERAGLYSAARGFTILKSLGNGTDGAVWKTSRLTALKICEHVDNYVREIDCYQRFLDFNAPRVINGFNVPKLLSWDYDALAFEMSIVERPYLVDFGKAYVDAKPDYASDGLIMRHWERKFQAEWGNRWKAVKHLLATLEDEYRIFYYDPKRDNIAF